MRSGRFALGCLLIAVTCGYAETAATSGSRVPTLRDAWFTTTVTVPGQKYDRNQPEHIWAKVEEFVRGKDNKVIMVVVFNDQGSHTIKGRRINPQGKEELFHWSITPVTGGTTGWNKTSKSWEVSKLAPGKHVVELTVDSTPAGRYSFTVK